MKKNVWLSITLTVLSIMIQSNAQAMESDFQKPSVNEITQLALEQYKKRMNRVRMCPLFTAPEKVYNACKEIIFNMLDQEMLPLIDWIPKKDTLEMECIEKHRATASSSVLHMDKAVYGLAVDLQSKVTHTIQKSKGYSVQKLIQHSEDELAGLIQLKKLQLKTDQKVDTAVLKKALEDKLKILQKKHAIHQKVIELLAGDDENMKLFSFLKGK